MCGPEIQLPRVTGLVKREAHDPSLAGWLVLTPVLSPFSLVGGPGRHLILFEV